MKKQMNRVVCALIIGAFIVGCSNSQSKQQTEQKKEEAGTAVPDMHTSEIALDYAGIYEGTLPAADGPGIKTELSLNKDKTFKQVSEYLGKKNAIFTDSGSYTIQKDIAILGIKGDTAYYKLEENQVVRLNQDQKPVTGSLAEHYILKQTKRY